MEWWKNFFDRDMEKILFPKSRWERARESCDALIDLLEISPPQKILDLACGVGRYSIPLAKKGFNVTGIDYSKHFIRKAKKKAEAENLKIHFLVGDMREIPFKNEFNAVICVFTSFGYFEKEEEHLKVLKEVKNSLKKNGKFLLELSNTEWLFKNFQSRDWVEEEEGFLLEKRELDFERLRINTKWIYIKGNETKKYSFSLRLFTLFELKMLLRKAGFVSIKSFSGFGKEEWNVTSPRTVILAINK